MSITVKFFASLREELNLDEVQINPQPEMTALNVWQQTTAKDNLPDKILIAVNQEYASDDAVISDGDEIAFFPPVTGG